ncbi:MAG TPA: hypothetical protein VFE01_06685 [Terracidiphilus sp.]|nr:hypothetical protein [Terracidiphilus sp.]
MQHSRSGGDRAGGNGNAKGALMLEGEFKRPVLGVGKPQAAQEPLFMPGRGEPGVIRGQ